LTPLSQESSTPNIEEYTSLALVSFHLAKAAYYSQIWKSDWEEWVGDCPCALG
jgi:hypothetical protein